MINIKTEIRYFEPFFHQTEIWVFENHVDTNVPRAIQIA